MIFDADDCSLDSAANGQVRSCKAMIRKVRFERQRNFLPILLARTRSFLFGGRNSDPEILPNTEIVLEINLVILYTIVIPCSSSSPSSICLSFSFSCSEIDVRGTWPVRLFGRATVSS